MSDLVDGLRERADWADYYTDAEFLRRAASHIEAQEKLIEEIVINVGDYLQKLGTMQAAMKDGLNVQGALSGYVAAEEALLESMERAATLSQKEENE